MSRNDWRPDPNSRRILEGPPPATPSPAFFLAGEIRRLNAVLGALPVERQAALVDDWGASFEELQRQRQAARTDADELAAVKRWSQHWDGVLR